MPLRTGKSTKACGFSLPSNQESKRMAERAGSMRALERDMGAAIMGFRYVNGE